ncbi:hypothetical protein WMY93_007044 [Mugilogobius chulae]|uniref:C2H2-type domain-containing protein n=1 Tax=Mugilogobius chulae TaxID=88201 RepID=A0AAW0PW59_9GOBI
MSWIGTDIRSQYRIDASTQDSSRRRSLAHFRPRRRHVTRHVSVFVPGFPTHTRRRTHTARLSVTSASKMSLNNNQALRGLVLQRLAVAADEIFALFERTFAQYEEEFLRSKLTQRQPRDVLYKEDIQTVTVGVDVSSEGLNNEPIKSNRDVNPPIKHQYPSATLKSIERDLTQKTRLGSTRGQLDAEEPGCSSDLISNNNRRHYGYSDTEDSDEFIEEMTNSKLNKNSAHFMKDSADNSCDYNFGSNTFMSNDDDQRDKLPKCTLCYKTFKNRETLEKHLEFHPGPFTCQICSKVFSSKSNYKTHLRCHAQQREKPHKCPVCGRGFLQKGHVKEHMRIHTGEKPYTCNDCGRQFRQQNSLMRHVLSMHSEVKPYRCSICQKGFVQKPYFESHMRKHTGERPFLCLVCGKRFKEKYCMKKHMSQHIEAGEITSQVVE